MKFAIGSLDQFDGKSQKDIMFTILLRNNPRFDNSLLQMAFEFDSKKVLIHKSVQELSDDLWRGRVGSEENYLTIKVFLNCFTFGLFHPIIFTKEKHVSLTNIF